MATQKKDSGVGVQKKDQPVGPAANKDTLTVVYVDGAPFHGMQQQREQEKINTQIKADLEVVVEE